MKIDRKRVIDAFVSYTAPYDITDEKIRLKVEHTYRVAGLCERIGRSIGLTGDALDLAWLEGMLHDIGRFEQIKIYGTFSDADSVDHAQFGADILFKEGKISDYLDVPAEGLDILETSIRNHSNYRIEEGLSEQMQMYCNILRDADKVDILKVNVDFPLEAIYNTTTEILRNAEVAPAVMESFAEEHATLRSLRKTAVDNVVGHISLAYELVYDESLRAAVQQGYLDKLMNFESYNPVTMEQFAEIRKMMNAYLARRGVI